MLELTFSLPSVPNIKIQDESPIFYFVKYWNVISNMYMWKYR